MKSKLNNSHYQIKFTKGSALLIFSLLGLSACTSTEKVAMKQSDVNCAFLAKDCSLLTVGGKEQTGLRYINPTVKWNQYSKILIDPVTFWGGDATKISAADQQMLVN